MNSGLSGKRPAWLTTLVLAITTGALAVAAALVMFSAFMFYDDEGYVLMSLRNFADHGGLYRDVYTQYGPFPFVVYWVLHTLGMPLTHTVGRLITLGIWTGTAVTAVALVGFVTRNLILRLWVLVSAFVYLWVMASEPSHPGGIIVILTVLLATLGYHWIAAGQVTRWAVAVGVVTAALILTKINIGVFLAYSACCWWILHHASDAVRRWALPLTVVWSVALPFALMRPLLSAPWVQTFVVVFATSSVALMIATSRRAQGVAGWRILGMGILGAAAVGVLVLGVVFFRGTTGADLLNGVLLGPLRHPVSFSLRYVWPTGIGALAVLSLVACIAACLLRGKHEKAVDGTIAAIRVLAGLALAINIARYPIVRPDYLGFAFALPWLWLMAWPLGPEKNAITGARTWVAFLLLGQCLHVFPVPGSQIAWGSVLVVPLAAMSTWEAARWLGLHSGITVLATRTARLAGHGVVIALFAFTTWQFGEVASRYREGRNLRLPGAEMIRLPDHSAALLRVMAHNASVHADVLFSLPGMFSFNLWTDVPPPTRANVTHWFSLLDAPRQQAVIDVLEAHPRACIIVDRGHLEFLAQRGITPQGPLHDYIARTFIPAFAVDRVEFCVHRGRSIQPFLLANLLERQPDADAQAVESTLLRFNVLLPSSAPVASIQIDASPTPLVLRAENARIEIAPVNVRGEQVGPPRAAPWPFTLTAPSIVSVFYNREAFPRPLRGATLALLSTDGSEVGLARLRQ